MIICFIVRIMFHNKKKIREKSLCRKNVSVCWWLCHDLAFGLNIFSLHFLFSLGYGTWLLVPVFLAMPRVIWGVLILWPVIGPRLLWQWKHPLLTLNQQGIPSFIFLSDLLTAVYFIVLFWGKNCVTLEFCVLVYFIRTFKNEIWGRAWEIRKSSCCC